jgi:hypothetical protein
MAPTINGRNGMKGSTVSTQPAPGVQSGKAAAAELGRMIKAQNTTKSLITSKLRIEPFNNLGGIDFTVLQKAVADAAGTTPTTVAPAPPPPSVTVEGITISVGESPVTTDVASPPATVSIVQDASDEELKRLVLDRTKGPLPVILSSTKMPELTPDDIDTFLEVPQFEKRMLSEAIVGGIEKVKLAGAPVEAKAAVEESRRALKSVDERIEAMAYMLDTMDTAASGLNVSKLSSQIMQRASDSLAPILAPTETSNDPLPSSLDAYIALSYTSPNIDTALTNTGRLALMMQDTSLACLTAHPATLTNLSRPPIHAGSLFSVPGAYRYDPDGPGARPEADIPTVNQLFTRNEDTIVGQFKRTRPAGSSRVTSRKNPGFITLDPDTTSTAGTQEEMWDDVVHSICALSNEMVLSAGIGRLQGSKLGNRFLERRADRPQQYDPIIRALGFAPGSTSEAVSRFITTGPDRTGSYLDYLALGEEVANRELIVMPFEVNTIVYGETPYVAGRQYFVEMAAQLERPALRGSLRRFSTQYTGVVRDLSSYFTELMALDTTTSLAPELLLARILQDFKKIIAALADGVNETERPGVFVAALFALCGFGDKTQVESDTGAVLVADVLKMSIIRALKSLDGTLTDTSFILSRQSTTYTTGPGDDNPENSLKSAIRSLGSVDASGGSRVALGSTVQELVTAAGQRFESFKFSPGGPTSSRSNTFLEGAAEINLVNLAALTIREIQKEALNLAQRGGAKTDYRNSTGGTLMSDCDDDRMIDVITTIYTNLAYLLLPVTIYNDDSNGTVGVLCDIDAARLGTAVVEDISNFLVNGTRITAEDIQNRRDVDPSTPINISPLGDNTAVTTPADLADIASRVVRHRYYIKAGLKIIEASAAGVTASSAKAARLFDVLSGDVNKKDLKGSEVVLYDMFVTNAEANRPLLRNVSSHQANLCAAGRSVYGTPGATEVRRDIATTTAERLALRDFMKEVYGRSISGLQVISVGVPNGLLDSLYNPALEVGEGQEEIVAARGTEADGRRRYVRVEVDRFDNVYFNSVSTVTTNIFGTSPSETEFDPEVFILPGDISYDPKAWPGGALTAMDAILRSTTFSRIRRGRVIEKTLGADVPDQEIGLYFNALRSYLLDLFMYDAIGVRHLDGYSPTGAPQLSSTGYAMLQTVSSDSVASKGLYLPAGFVDLYNPNTRRVKTGEDLRAMLTPVSPYVSPRFNRSDVMFAALLACTSPVSDPAATVVFRPYERVYHFLYDETVVRNQVSGDTLDIKARRRQFDIYTLAARVSYGGGTSGS